MSQLLRAISILGLVSAASVVLAQYHVTKVEFTPTRTGVLLAPQSGESWHSSVSGLTATIGGTVHSWSQVFDGMHLGGQNRAGRIYGSAKLTVTWVGSSTATKPSTTTIRTYRSILSQVYAASVYDAQVGSCYADAHGELIVSHAGAPTLFTLVEDVNDFFPGGDVNQVSSSNGNYTWKDLGFHSDTVATNQAQEFTVTLGSPEVQFYTWANNWQWTPLGAWLTDGYAEASLKLKYATSVQPVP